MTLDTPRWIEHLRHTAASHAAVDRLLGLGELEPAFRVAVGADTRLAPDATPPAGVVGETALWWALVENSIDPGAVIASRDDGPLLPADLHHTLEVRTEAELCALHALSRLARERERADWRGRVARARDWHLEHTQPDNFTNRPWSLHVFLTAGTPEADLYAQTLLHNTLAIEGRPEPLSAWILLDCARELERATRIGSS